MKTKFFNEWDKLKMRDNINFYIIVILAVILVVQTIAIINIVQNRTVVILPPQVDQEFQIVGNTLSKSYLEQVSFYISDRIMSLSPSNAKVSLESIAPFLSTDVEHLKVIKKTLEKEAELIISENLFQSFYPNKFQINEKDKIMTVTGVLRKYIGDMFVQSKDQKIDYPYEIKSGRLIIKGVNIR